MSHRNYAPREGGRNHTDPTSSRFNARSKYHQRGGRGARRPMPDRRPTVGEDLQRITVSIDQNLMGSRNFSHDSSNNRIVERRDFRPRTTIDSTGRPDPHANQAKWWRVSIPQAGSFGKERVMSTLKAHCLRQFQPYHYFVDRDTNTGVFFVNSQQDADMLKRANRKVEVQNLGTLSIMVSHASCPAPVLDEDLRRYFKDFITNHRFNPQTFQLNLSNLTDDEELSSLGIYPQLNKAAFVRDLVTIINTDFQATRQLDLGSNNIANLYEFRKLQLNNLEQLSLASNDVCDRVLKNFEELNHLKQLTHLTNLYLKDNPLTSPNNRRTGSNDDLISCMMQLSTIIGPHSSAIRQKLPQLKRLDGQEMPAVIGFGVDQGAVTLPKSVPHCVPQDMQGFLAKFIDEYYRLFDTSGRADLHACYHDSCILSVCISPTEGSIVPTRQYKFGALIYDSRNLKRIFDENKRAALLRRGKINVLDFLRIKFPLTKHDGNSFHVDVISTTNNRAIFAVNGLYREVDQGNNGPVRSFQRVFTCLQTSTGVLIIADHLMVINATEVQFTNMTRSVAPATTSGTASSQMDSQNSNDPQHQMIVKFSRESGMNFEFSKRCLAENNWDYNNAAKIFLDLKNKNAIPAEAFK